MRPRFASAPVRLPPPRRGPVSDEDAFWDILDRRGRRIAKGITLAQVRARRQHGLMPNAALMAREGTSEWHPIDEVLLRARTHETLWYVTRPGGAVVGPVDTDRIRRGLREGLVPVDSMVCRAGTKSWVRIDAVAAFADAATEAEFDAAATTMHSAVRSVGWSFETW
jgi:hypothetical protein